MERIDLPLNWAHAQELIAEFPYWEDEILMETIPPTSEPRTKEGAKLAEEMSANIKSEASSTVFDPIESAMRNKPGLTREEAEEMASLVGY